MIRTYTCKICGATVRTQAIPKIIADRQLCVECHKADTKAFEKVFYHKEV